MNDPMDDDVAREFELLADRHGLRVPPGLREGALANYAALRAVLPLLRTGLPPQAEPAACFRVGAATDDDGGFP